MLSNKNAVITFEYAAFDDQGNMLENSRDSGALSYVHGFGKVVPGLEEALDTKRPGDTFSITLNPRQAYGERREGLIHQFPTEELSKLGDLKTGMQLQAEDEKGKRILTITEITDDHVILDENHPLAGKTIKFDVHVISVRDATEEELQRGQAYNVSCRDDCTSCAINSKPDSGDSCGCGCSNH